MICVSVLLLAVVCSGVATVGVACVDFDSVVMVAAVCADVVCNCFPVGFVVVAGAVGNRVVCISVRVDTDATDSLLCEKVVVDVDVALLVSGVMGSSTTDIVSAGVVLRFVVDAIFSAAVVVDCLVDAV